MRTLLGIDVSNHNGGLDYTNLSKSINFVIIQSSYGTTRNPLFLTHVNGFRAAKTPIPGVYHFIYAVTPEQAKRNAERAIKSVQEAGLPRDTRIWADFEYDSVDYAAKRGITLGAAECNEYTMIFCETVRKAGYPTGIYCNVDFYENWYNKELLKRYPVWLCDLSGKCKYPCLMWQYSWKGFDWDIWFKPEDGELTDGEIIDAGEPKTVDEAIDRLLAVAEAEVGYREKASPYNLDDKDANAGSANYTKYGRTMHAVQPSNMDYPAPYCDCFVDWCFYTTFGADLARRMLCGDFDDYTVNSANLYKNAGRWYTSGKRGDQIFFRDNDGICHTGLVEKVSSGIVYTIEGNKSNMVKRCQYHIYDNTIAGYGRPKYDLALPGQEEGYMFSTETVRNGSKGASVLLLQKLLKADGYTGSNGAILALDSDFGGNTEAALKEYQRKHAGLSVDGVCGPATWKSILGL